MQLTQQGDVLSTDLTNNVVLKEDGLDGEKVTRRQRGESFPHTVIHTSPLFFSLIAIMFGQTIKEYGVHFYRYANDTYDDPDEAKTKLRSFTFMILRKALF